MRPRVEQPVIPLILRDLESGPATVHDLEETVRINQRNLRPYLKMLWHEGRVVIVAWEQRTGPALPVYGLEGSNRPRPRRKYKRRGP